MTMKEDDLVRLMDAYMGCEGYYMKPKIEEDGKNSFFIAKDSAKLSDVSASFGLVEDAIGTKEEKELQIFEGTPKVECAVCADVPNLSDVDEKSGKVKLYNMVLPIWLLWIVPVTWLVIFPANFAIDLLVTFLTLKFLGITERKAVIKKSIWKTWIFGFIADFIGVAWLFLAELLDFDYQTDLGKWWNHNIANPLVFNPFNNIFSFLYALVAVVIAGVFIYIFNLKICLKKTDLNDELKKKTALSLAIFTAPYLFFLPTGLFLS